MVHPTDMGCKPTYRWEGSERVVRWYHCEPGDVRTRRDWDGTKWIVTVRCLTCGARIEG
jgi:hypothetical protein